MILGDLDKLKHLLKEVEKTKDLLETDVYIYELDIIINILKEPLERENLI